MNKTVNINLAGIFFHIDEDAYAILQRYLNAIRESFTNTPGQEEIMADIEARVAELFNEKIKDKRQVIGSKEVEEVMTVMGKPEDYLVDEEIFEDEARAKHDSQTQKQLFRDPENGYIGGVAKGLAYYMGIEAIWVRLLWILLTIGSSGGVILIYLALWIFVPEARTTADKLAMRGEPVNISNIERKIKEGFDGVSGKMKDIDYEKYGYKAKKGADSAATAVGSGITILLNVFVKFIGILLILIAGTTLIGLFIGLFTLGTFGIIDAPWPLEMAMMGSEYVWIFSLLSFFAIGIPFFFLLVLGLKILMKNLKSIGTTAKLVLLGVWIIAVLGIVFFGIKQATQYSYDGEVVITETLPIAVNDTLYLHMQEETGSSFIFHNSGMKIRVDENDQKIRYSSDVEVYIRSTQDSVARMEIIKSAVGKNYQEARAKAEDINYNTNFSNNELFLDDYLTTSLENSFRDQEIKIRLYLPVGSVLFASQNLHRFHGYGILSNSYEEQFLRITQDGAACLTCPTDENQEENWIYSEDDTTNKNNSNVSKNDSIETNGGQQKLKMQNNPADSLNL